MSKKVLSDTYFGVFYEHIFIKRFSILQTFCTKHIACRAFEFAVLLRRNSLLLIVD